ncbi:MAG: hypothetical protein RJB01_982 [Actinomycetota bacterium]
MTETPRRKPRTTRVVFVVMGSLLMVLGVSAVSLATIAWTVIPGGSLRSPSLVAESDDCPFLVLEEPAVSIQVSGSEWLQQMVALEPWIEISSPGEVLTVPSESLPDLILGVPHCRLAATDAWKVLTIPGAYRNLDVSARGVSALDKSAANISVISPGDLQGNSLVIKDPGAVGIQGLLAAPWSVSDVQWAVAVGVALMLMGALTTVVGIRLHSRGKHEADD